MKIRRQKMMSLAHAQRMFPQGARVRYFPIAGEKTFTDHEIRSEPWQLGHGQVVIKLTGKVGGVAVEHLEKI